MATFKNYPHFRDNSHLYPTSGNATDLVSLSARDGDLTYASTAGATSFQLFKASKGKDTITNFDSNDTIAVDHALFDGNGDGYIDFGANHVLDVNRTSGSKAGNYQVRVTGNGNDNIGTIRSLGSKDGAFVYAAATTRDQLLGHFKTCMDSTHGLTSQSGDSSLAGVQYRYESSVNNDTIDAGAGSTAILFDNALGVNLGSDTINNFGSDDLLIFTADVYKHKSPGAVGFGTDKVLDLSSQSPLATDPSVGPGGQIDVNGVGHDIQSLTYLGAKTIGTGVSAVTYYYYGTADHAPLAGLTT